MASEDFYKEFSEHMATQLIKPNVSGRDYEEFYQHISKLRAKVETQAMMAQSPPRQLSFLDMIKARMRTDKNLPLDAIHIHEVTSEVIVVFIVNKGQYVTIEDSAALFPSDALMTKLRVLMG